MTMIAIVLGGIALCVACCAWVTIIRNQNRDMKRSADYGERLERLEKGEVPDFEQAKAAIKAVNDFNSGISGILGFDPYEAIARKRDGEDGGVLN